jgi:hypothetical protein
MKRGRPLASAGWRDRQSLRLRGPNARKIDIAAQNAATCAAAFFTGEAGALLSESPRKCLN